MHAYVPSIRSPSHNTRINVLGFPIYAYQHRKNCNTLIPVQTSHISVQSPWDFKEWPRKKCAGKFLDSRQRHDSTVYKACNDIIIMRSHDITLQTPCNDMYPRCGDECTHAVHTLWLHCVYTNSCGCHSNVDAIHEPTNVDTIYTWFCRM